MKRKPHFTALLPPTNCTEQMRSELVQIAEEHGASLGQLQRIAIARFVHQYRKLPDKTRIFTAQW